MWHIQLARNKEDEQEWLLGDKEVAIEVHNELLCSLEKIQQTLLLAKPIGSTAITDLMWILWDFLGQVFTFADVSCLSPSPLMLEPRSHMGNQFRHLCLQKWSMPRPHQLTSTTISRLRTSPSSCVLVQHWPDIHHQLLLQHKHPRWECVGSGKHKYSQGLHSCLWASVKPCLLSLHGTTTPTYW